MQLNPSQIAIFQSSLLEFYQQYPIEKPWLRDRNPYKIWLLEVLSQQTRMDQAMPYYENIIKRCPTIEHLAELEEDELYSLWKGLGYYSRARNLHFSAQWIVQNRNGIFPSTYQDIIQLKGVGEYTAAAIASFAFREDVAVLDGNVHRVLARFWGIDKTIQSSSDKKIFQNIANQLIIRGQSDIYNQSMMNLGSQTCTPQNPKCQDCPMSSHCFAFQNNTTKKLPPPKTRPILKNRYFYCLFLEIGNHILLKKRSEKDIWRGLYEGVVQEGEEIDHEFWGNKKIDISETTWSEWDKQILSHQCIYMKIGHLKCNSIHIKSDLKIPISQITKIAFPRIISKWWENRL